MPWYIVGVDDHFLNSCKGKNTCHLSTTWNRAGIDAALWEGKSLGQTVSSESNRGSSIGLPSCCC